MDERADVVIVGAGLAGLAAAAAAARAGQRTLVLDTRAPGGRATTTDRRGYRFNQGPHALYNAGPGRAVLDRLGVAVRAHQPPIGGALGLRGGELLPFPIGGASLLRSPLLGWRSRARAGLAFASLPRLNPSEHAGLTFAQWLDEQGWPDDVRGLVAALGRIASYCGRPDEISADVVLAQLQLAISAGVGYLDGGWQSIIDGLAAVAARDGATVRGHAIVRAVVPGNDGVVVELAEGRVLASTAVLAAGSPAANAALLPSDPGWVVGPPLEASCLDLGLVRPAPTAAVFGIDAPLYLVQHAPPADLAPAGAAVVHVAEYLGAVTEPSSARLDEHAARAGITPELVAERRHLHRMTVVSAAPTPVTGGLAGRPAVASTGHANVLVAGDFVGRSGFLADASLSSGEEAGLLAARLASRVRA